MLATFCHFGQTGVRRNEAPLFSPSPQKSMLRDETLFAVVANHFGGQDAWSSCQRWAIISAVKMGGHPTTAAKKFICIPIHNIEERGGKGGGFISADTGLQTGLLDGGFAKTHFQTHQKKWARQHFVANVKAPGLCNISTNFETTGAGGFGNFRSRTWFSQAFL